MRFHGNGQKMEENLNPKESVPLKTKMRTELKTFIIGGARPNFMKIAPIWEEMQKHPAAFSPQIIHTGQHYGEQMSDIFFKQLGIARPHISFNVGSGTHAEQTAAIMLKFEKLCLQQRPKLIVVVGDVNSTMACALVGAKLNIKIAHIEAGLRSGDRTMPEEIAYSATKLTAIPVKLTVIPLKVDTPQ